MSGSSLPIPVDVLRTLIDHARRELPNEACGILSADLAAGGRVRYHAARNSLASPTAFDLHPEDLVRIVYDIEAAGEEMLAVVHSHPRSAAVPSATDARNAAYRVPYLIVSPLDDACPYRAWDLAGGTGREVAVEVLAEPGSASRPGDVHDQAGRGVHADVG